MLRKAISLALVAIGLVMTLSGLGALVQPGAAQAQAVPQPTPRPPLDENDDDGDSPAPDAMGHVTGTVIDSATGAPVPYAQVVIGDQTVTADANGNYDLWVPVGTYAVSMPPVDGVPAESHTVVVVAGEAAVQHLNRPSAAPVPVVATPEPTVGPVVKAAPVEPVEPVEVAAPEADGPMVPGRLPATAENAPDLFGAWFWVSLGLALLAGGMMIGMRADALRAPAFALARYAHSSGETSNPAADAAALLAALLTTEIRGSRGGSDPLLAMLLDADARKRRAAQELLADLLSRPIRG